MSFEGFFSRKKEPPQYDPERDPALALAFNSARSEVKQQLEFGARNASAESRAALESFLDQMQAADCARRLAEAQPGDLHYGGKDLRANVLEYVHDALAQRIEALPAGSDRDALLDFANGLE
jgi:hypothetical protein